MLFLAFAPSCAVVPGRESVPAVVGACFCTSEEPRGGREAARPAARVAWRVRDVVLTIIGGSDPAALPPNTPPRPPDGGLTLSLKPHRGAVTHRFHAARQLRDVRGKVWTECWLLARVRSRA